MAAFGCRDGGIEQLLLPQIGNAAAGHVRDEHFGQLFDVLGASPVALPLASKSHPSHHVNACRNHPLDGDLMRFG